MKQIVLAVAFCWTFAAYAGQPQNDLHAALEHLRAIGKASSRQVIFNLASLDGATEKQAVATVQGPLSGGDLVAMLRALPLVANTNSIKGPWRLSVIGNQQFARVVIKPLPSCENENAEGSDWILVLKNGVWSIVAELPTEPGFICPSIIDVY